MGRGGRNKSGGGGQSRAQAGQQNGSQSSPRPARVTPYSGGHSFNRAAYSAARAQVATRHAVEPERQDVEIGGDWTDENGRAADVKWMGNGEVIAEYPQHDEVEVLGYVGSENDAREVLKGHEEVALDGRGKRALSWVKDRVYAYVRANESGWDESEPVRIQRPAPEQSTEAEPATDTADATPAAQPERTGVRGAFDSLFGNRRGV